MKISNRNYPILQKLFNKSLGNMPVFEKDELFFALMGQEFVKYWKMYNKEFQSNIVFVSREFIRAAELAQSKLLDLYGDIVKGDLSDYNTTGTYLLINQVVMIHHSFKKGSEDLEVVIYAFDNSGIPLFYYIESAEKNIKPIGWMSNVMRELHKIPPGVIFYDGENTPAMLSVIWRWVWKVVLFDMFKTYAQVDTKYLLPGKKIKDVNCKYINDTKLPITYLDSKWFTNLVKSDAFKVRGHFRLQPKKKDGKWTRELIWISDFMKSGYTAPARKLTHESL